MTKAYYFRKASIYFGCAISLFILGLLFISGNTEAESNNNGCDSAQVVSYTGTITPTAKEKYDVYVRLGKRGQQAPVTVYVRSNIASVGCGTIGSIEASGDRWLLAGTWTPQTLGDRITLQLSSANLNSSSDTNRPALMLINHNNPLCVPTTECIVNVDGQQGYIRPSGSVQNRNSLYVLPVTDPNTDTVQSVDYYIDNQIQYSTSTLQPFDMRYVSNKNQTLDRVITYTSGQQVVLPADVPSDFTDSIGGILYRFTRVNQKVVKVVLSIVATAIVLGIALLILRIWSLRHLYLIHHGLAKESNILASHKRLGILAKYMLRVWHAILIVLMLFGAVILAWAITNFCAQIAVVNGVSMENTYQNGTHVLVNKMPKTWSSISDREYVPRRGEVIVAKLGITDYEQSDTAYRQSYIIKRVIGLPGERVVIKDAHIIIYNTTHPNGFDPDSGSPWQKSMEVSTNNNEDLDLTLGPSELFVMGDNRPSSVDSRSDGPISTKQIIGEVSTKLWPL